MSTTAEKHFDVISKVENDSTIETAQLSKNSGRASKKRFKCKYCFKQLASKRNLVGHERIHQNEKPYSCLICGKNFRTKNTLLEHGYLHTNEKPFQCSECGKCFRHRSSLSTHQTIHKGNPSNECIICQKAFRLKSGLSAHLFTHIDCKPYRCSCGEAFRRNWYLTRHLRKYPGFEHFAVVENSPQG